MSKAIQNTDRQIAIFHLFKFFFSFSKQIKRCAKIIKIICSELLCCSTARGKMCKTKLKTKTKSRFQTRPSRQQTISKAESGTLAATPNLKSIRFLKVHNFIFNYLNSLV